MPRLKEIDVQIACVDFLRLDGWRPLRTDPCSDRGRAKGFGEEGMADHLFLRYKACADFCATPIAIRACAEVLWVEFKRPAGRDARGRRHKGTLPTFEQALWHQAERAEGGLTVMAGIDFESTFDGFVDWYRGSGLLRRQGL